jgi:squalene-hopene/tetraprenyl-beta-curcumene cyclase
MTCNLRVPLAAVWILVPVVFSMADETTPSSSRPADIAPLEAVTLDNVTPPGENSAAEPLAEQFSFERGKRFLDSASLAWQKQRDCMTCHTNYLYLLARPALGAGDPAHRTVREYAERLVTDRWPKQGPRWDAEVVMTAMALAFNDRLTSGKLHPTTRTALDRMWTVQRDDGGVTWIHCGWPPFEFDDEFGATMMALAVAVAPEDYAQTPAVQAGIARLRKYLADNELPTLHHRAMLLWADIFQPGWLSPADRQALLAELMALQHEDGSWSIATLGDWQRADGSLQDTTHGDGYATGLVIVLARGTGIPADDPRLARGVAWLKSNQRESGRWFTRSLKQDGRHYLTHSGSSLALMALSACDAVR